MRIRLPGLAVSIAAALLAYASPASAQAGFQPAPGLGGLVLDLDTQGGNASHLIVPGVCGLNAVRTTISVRRLGIERRWLPTGSIGLSSNGKWVGFRFGGARDFPLPIVVDTIDRKLVPFTLQIVKDEDLHLAVDWTPDGQVRFTIGAETLKAKLPGPVDSIKFSNSTSEVMFSSISLGRTSGTVHDCPVG